MKIIIDMNLSPDWKEVLATAGWESVHWQEIGDPRAPDSEIMAWAIENGHVVFTHDLDFGALLAASGARIPSVIQFRDQGMLPEDAVEIVESALRQFETLLADGALITVDRSRTRARVLPIRKDPRAR